MCDKILQERAFHSVQNSGNQVRNQAERTILVTSDRNILDHLQRWSSFTGPLISVGPDRNVPFHFLNCCPQYRSFLSCLQEKYLKARSLESGLYNWNVPFPKQVEFRKFSNQNFFFERKAP